MFLFATLISLVFLNLLFEGACYLILTLSNRIMACLVPFREMERAKPKEMPGKDAPKEEKHSRKV